MKVRVACLVNRVIVVVPVKEDVEAEGESKDEQGVPAERKVPCCTLDHAVHVSGYNVFVSSILGYNTWRGISYLKGFPIIIRQVVTWRGISYLKGFPR